MTARIERCRWDKRRRAPRKESKTEERRSNRHHLFFFCFDDLVDAGAEVVGGFLHAIVPVFGVVRGDLLFLLRLLQVLDGYPPMIAHRYTVLLGDLLDVLYQLLAPLLRQLRNRNAHTLAVVTRRDHPHSDSAVDGGAAQGA